MSQPEAGNPFASEHVMEPYNETWAIKRAINRKLKKIALQQVTKKASLDALRSLDAALDQVTGILEPAPELRGRDSWVADGEYGPVRIVSREIAPLAGQSNVIAPALHMWFDTEAKKSYGRVTVDWLYEGPPFCVHGGIVAALFDEFLGCTQILSGKTGATGILNLKYHLPTPLNTELRFEGEVKAVEGRKITCAGNLYANGQRTVSGEGLFITIPEGVNKLLEASQLSSQLSSQK